MAERNRVTPRSKIVRPWGDKRCIIGATDFKARQRALGQPGRYTTSLP